MIIHSLLDTDLYKFTMMQVVLHHFPGARVEYRFKCRNAGIDLAQFASQIREEVRHLCSLQFRDAELSYLRSMRFIKSDFVDFLGLFRLNEKYIKIADYGTRRRFSKDWHEEVLRTLSARLGPVTSPPQRSVERPPQFAGTSN